MVLVILLYEQYIHKTHKHIVFEDSAMLISHVQVTSGFDSFCIVVAVTA